MQCCLARSNRRESCPLAFVRRRTGDPSSAAATCGRVSGGLALVSEHWSGVGMVSDLKLEPETNSGGPICGVLGWYYSLGTNLTIHTSSIAILLKTVFDINSLIELTDLLYPLGSGCHICFRKWRMIPGAERSSRSISIVLFKCFTVVTKLRRTNIQSILFNSVRLY